jgi:nucleotide-binding universal stress UspA family protein
MMKILLPTDGSEYSEAAVRFLKRLQVTSQDEITLLHVISDDPFQDKDDYYYEKIKEVKEGVAPRILESALQILKPAPAKINPVIMSGYPDKCIVDAAVSANVDIIIMGHKRLKGIKSHIIGSVTKSVSINSPKPVLVIKQPRSESPERLKILFATDGSASARKAAEMLALIPFPDTTAIIILHVITPAFHDIPDKYVTGIERSVKEDLKRYRAEDSHEIIAQTAEYLRRKFPAVETVTKTGDPSDEILGTADELKADMIVVGSKGMGGLRGAISSLSRYILSVAECSVLIGKTEGA